MSPGRYIGTKESMADSESKHSNYFRRGGHSTVNMNSKTVTNSTIKKRRDSKLGQSKILHEKPWNQASASRPFVPGTNVHLSPSRSAANLNKSKTRSTLTEIEPGSRALNRHTQ